MSEEELLATCSPLLYGTPPPTLRRPVSSSTLESSLAHPVLNGSNIAPCTMQPARAMSESNLRQAHVQNAVPVRAKQVVIRHRMQRRATSSIQEQPVLPTRTWVDSCVVVGDSPGVRTLRATKTPPSKSSNNSLSQAESFWDTVNPFTSPDGTSTTTTPAGNEPPSTQLDLNNDYTRSLSPLKHVKVDSTRSAVDILEENVGSAKPTFPMDNRRSHPFPTKERKLSATTAPSSPESNIIPTTPRVSPSERVRLRSASPSGALQLRTQQTMASHQQASPVPLLLHQAEYDNIGRQVSFSPLNAYSLARHHLSDEDLVSVCFPLGKGLKSAQSMPHIESSSRIAPAYTTSLTSPARTSFKRPSAKVRVKTHSTDFSSFRRRPSWANIRSLRRKKSTASSFLNMFSDRVEDPVDHTEFTGNMAPVRPNKPGIGHKGSAPILRQTYSHVDQPVDPIPFAGVSRRPSTAPDPPAGGARGLRARASALKLRTTARIRSLVSVNGS